MQESNTIQIIQGLWIGPELSRLEKLCINSFLKNGHEFHLYTYQDVIGIPEKCKIKDANDIIPKDEIFYYSDTKGNPSAFSNMFRYKLLYDLGGYWSDMDMICLKKI